MEKPAEKIIHCRICGNVGINKVRANYIQEITDYCDGEPEYLGDCEWSMMECPVCHNISLFKRYIDKNMMYGTINTDPIEEIVFPVANS